MLLKKFGHAGPNHGVVGFRAAAGDQHCRHPVTRLGCGRAMDRPLSPHNGVRRARRPCNAQARPIAAAAFTLLELLAVVAIVGVLALIAFTAADGASERSRRQRCRADLAVLAQALEGYRAQFGDYPQTGPVANDPAGAAAADDGPGILFNALAGRRGPGVPLVPIESRPHVSLAVFSLQTDELPTVANTNQTANAFLDPWGRRYLYFYRTGTSWLPRAPLLLSAGPDGVVTVPTDLAAWDGALPAGASANTDNLLASGS